jgi:hypothetical protein
VTERVTGRGAGSGGRPATLNWAIVLLAVETVGVAAAAVFLVYEDATATAVYRRGAWSITGLAVAMAALLALLCWALVRRRGWARGPAIVLELMLLPIGYYMIRGGVPWLGVPVLLLGLFGAGLLLTPSSREALGVR